VYRAVSFKLTPRGIEADLSGQPSGRAFVKAAAQASDESLAAMIPLLLDDVDCASGVLMLPARYDGLRLSDEGDPGLTWIRQTCNVQVFAVKLPGEATWLGGGRITELPLRTGTELAVSGTSEEIDAVRTRFREGDPKPIAMTSRTPSRA
jgi:hypothetical protein